MNLLITGGCGFLGSNLSAAALARGDRLTVFDNLGRLGASENLAWLRSQGDFEHHHGDIRDENDVVRSVRAVQPDCVFHLAGQVAMTTSIKDPRRDFQTNALGTVNILEAVRAHAPEAGVIYSSTNKVYGDLEQFAYHETKTRFVCVEAPNGFDERTPLQFHSPYGCSKGAADQYMLDYARVFSLRTVVLRHSSMYGGRQFATYDQGWVGWFCQQALAARDRRLAKPFTISGTGKQVRDVLYAEDLVSLYYMLAARLDDVAGEVFNAGGGVANSLSLLELFDHLEKTIGIELRYEKLPPRASDQKVFVADIGKLERSVGWTPRIDYRTGISRMLTWLEADAAQ